MTDYSELLGRLYLERNTLSRKAATAIETLTRELAEGEKERDALRDKVNFTLTDGQRLIRKQDVEGFCRSPDMCFEGSPTARCHPCAADAALSLIHI